VRADKHECESRSRTAPCRVAVSRHRVDTLGTVTRLLRHPLAREFSWLSMSIQLSTLLSFVSFLVLVRLTPIGTVGQIVFAQAVVAVIMLVLDARFEDAVQFYFPKLASRSTTDAAQFFWKLAKWDAIFGVAVVAVGCLIWLFPTIPQIGAVRYDFMALALSSAGVSTVVGTFNAGFAIKNRLVQLGKYGVVLALASSAMVILGTIIYGPIGYLTGALLGSIVQVATLFIASRRLLPNLKPSNPRAPLPPGLWRFLITSSAATSLAVGSDAGMITIIGAAGGPTVTAFVKIAQAPGRLIQSFFSPVATQAFPRLTLSALAHDKNSITLLVRRMTLFVIIPGVTLLAALSPAMRWLLGVTYGADYARVAPAAVGMAVAGLIRSSTGWAKVLPLALGRPRLRLGIVGTDTVISCVGTLIIISTVSDSFAALNALAWLMITVATGLSAFWLTFLTRLKLKPRDDSTTQPLGAIVRGDRTGSEPSEHLGGTP